MQAWFRSHPLLFKTPGGTSRGVLHEKPTWFLFIADGSSWGVGECAMFPGLSADDRPDYEERLQWTCDRIAEGPGDLWSALEPYPSIQFGWEQAVRSLASEDPFVLFPSPFTDAEAPIEINGLIWMGPLEHMASQITAKLEEGFDCIKLKIGALDFDSELDLLNELRAIGGESLTIRVDANGAFEIEEAPRRLERLARLGVHSIEQPIRAGQDRAMAELCGLEILPIALDESLIGVFGAEPKKELLESIRPQYIILKPSLIGGFTGSLEWIRAAESIGAGWWVTSALESNVGLNAIAQWTYTLGNPLPQGLGTGGLFTNNIEAPLTVVGGKLIYQNSLSWSSNLKTGACT